MNKFYKIILFLVPLLFFVPNININAEDLDQEEQNNSFSGLYGYDIDVYGYWTLLGYQSSYFYNASVNVPNSGYYSNFGTSILDTVDLSDYYQTYPYFIFIQDKDSTNNTYLYLTDNPDCKMIFGNNKCGVFDVGNMVYLHITPSNGVFVVNSVTAASGDFALSQRQNDRFIFSNIDVYGSVGTTNNWQDLINSEYHNINYCLYDSNGNLVYNNPIVNGGGSSGENASNNLYMQNPNWQFKNIPSFGTILDTNSRGQAIFSAQLTDYQKENLNKFRLDFTFNTFWNGNTYHIGVDDITVIKDPFSKSFLYQVQVPLSEFYSGGSMYSIYIDDIFNNSVSSDQDQTIDDFASFYINEYNHETNNFRTSFTVNLVSLDNSGESGSCTSYFSYKTGTSQTTNNSMGINSNPYVDDDGSASGVTDPTQDSGDGSGSGVGNVGDGSIVNNNNPVININNNNSLSDGDSDGLISKILLLIANNQSATSSGIEEIADTSGFVELMGATWLAVPATWWTTLTAAFIASIGILVVGFILKIIIGLIF